MRTIIFKTAFIFTLGITVFFACRSSEGVKPGLAPNTVSVKSNQSARFPSGITVVVDTIFDNRCPIGYKCIVAGGAGASLTISLGADFQKRKLTLDGFSKARRDSTTVQFQNLTYTVILRDVVPYPDRIQQPEQQAIIQVSRLQ